MLLREEEDFNLGDYAQKVGDMVSKGLYTVGRGVPQALTGFPDLFSLPLTLSGMAKPEDIIGTTDYLTKRGLLPGPEQTLFGDSSAGTQADMLLGSTTPAGATKTALLGLAPFLPSEKNYLQEMFGQGKNVFEQTADLSKDINAPMLSKMYGKGGGGGLLGKFDDMDEYGYYSPTLRAVENINQPSGTGEQFLNMIKKSTKEEERAWMGLDDFLQSKDKFTKQEVMDYVKDNTINIQRDKLFDFRQLDETTGKGNYDQAMDERRDQLEEFALGAIQYNQMRFGDDFRQFQVDQGDRGSYVREKVFNDYLGDMDDDMDRYDFQTKLQAAKNIIEENKQGMQMQVGVPEALFYSEYVTNQDEIMKEFMENELPKFVGPSLKNPTLTYARDGEVTGIDFGFNVDTSQLEKVVNKISKEEARLGRGLYDDEIEEFLKKNRMFEHSQDSLSETLDAVMTELAEVVAIEDISSEMNMPFDLYSNTGYQLRNVSAESDNEAIMYNGRDETPELIYNSDNPLDNLHVGVANVELQEQRVVRNLEGYPAPTGLTGGMAEVGAESYSSYTFSQKGTPDAPNYQVYGYRFKNPPQRGQDYEIDVSLGSKPDIRYMDLKDIDDAERTGAHYDIPESSTSKMKYSVHDALGYGLAHLRVTERVVDEYPDQKALFTEEIQSDAHKMARGDRGAYVSEIKDIKLFQNQTKDLSQKFKEVDESLESLPKLTGPGEYKANTNREKEVDKYIKAQNKQEKERDKKQLKLINENKNTVLKSMQMALQKLDSDLRSQILAKHKKSDELYDAGIDSPDKLKQFLESSITENEYQDIDGFMHKGEFVPLYGKDVENIEHFFETRKALNILKNKDVSAEQILKVANDAALEDLYNSVYSMGTKDRKANPNLLELSLKSMQKRMKRKADTVFPDFPLKNEHEFGVKESIKLAIDEGYDRVVFPTFKSVYSATGKASQENYRKMQKFVDSYAKKIGATVEEVTMTGRDGRKYKFKSIPITEELKNLIKNIGQPIVRRQDGAMGLLAMNEPMSMGIM